MMFTSAKTATACISATILLISVKALAAPLDEYRVACQPSQLAIIAAAMDEARALLKAASNSLPPPNSSIGSKFKRWFGGSDGDNDPKLKQAYTEVEGFLTMKTFWCPNKTMPNRGPALAFVPKGSFTEIFFEVGFFNLAKSGADSRGGTIVHEISHQSTFNPTVDSDVTGDGKPDYGVSNAEQLARARSNVARHTADNFEYFAEDVLFGIK